MADHPVVACSRGPDSAEAVRLGARLAAAVGQPLLIASAYRYEPVVLTPGVIATSSNALRYDVAEARVDEAVRSVPAAVEARGEIVPAEDIPRALVDLAHEADACALVVGGDVESDVTRKLLEHAPCPLVVATSGSAPVADEPPRMLGVAWDGSPGARCALHAAIQLAGHSGAQIRIISVGSGIDTQAAAARLPDASEADIRRLGGHPGERLAAASAELDLLLCGTHGRGRVAAAVLGSVSAHLLEAARCPVLVIPPRARPRAKGPLGLTTAAE